MTWSDRAREAAREARRRKANTHGLSRKDYAQQLKYARKDVGHAGLNTVRHRNSVVRQYAKGRSEAYARIKAEEGTFKGKPRGGLYKKRKARRY